MGQGLAGTRNEGTSWSDDNILYFERGLRCRCSQMLAKSYISSYVNLPMRKKTLCSNDVHAEELREKITDSQDMFKNAFEKKSRLIDRENNVSINR